MFEHLTLEQRACNFETMQHMARLRDLLNGMVIELLRRGEVHDQSKLRHPEVEAFTAETPLLKTLVFGSPEYEAARARLGGALAHHYANNRHHPEHFPDGIRGMNLIDLLEMFCDWKAGSERHDSGNIRKSIEHNGRRFNMPTELIEIFVNTIDLLVPPRI